jgi:dTDP-4-dehydrorhamnose 3,5-epimerase
MIFTPTRLEGAVLIELERHEDERGFFARTWSAEEFAAAGLNPRLVQCSIAGNVRRHTLRGMHFQVAPHEEAKLVRCSRGALYDVVIDLRRGSRTFGEWLAVELSATNGRMLYVPEGFAHGYQTLEDDTEASYQMSQAYAPQSAAGVRWDDPFFGIQWPPAGHRIVSERDRTWPDFSG